MIGLGEEVEELPEEVATETVPTGVEATVVGAVLLTNTGAVVGTL